MKSAEIKGLRTTKNTPNRIVFAWFVEDDDMSILFLEVK